MKKFLKLSSFAIALLLLIATLAACSGPAKDADDARRALKGNGYDVKHYEENDTYLQLLTNSFDVYGLEDLIIAYDHEDRAKAENFIVIFYFDEDLDAEESMSAVRDIIDVLKAEMKLADFDPDLLETLLEQSGDLIWWGTDEAADAAK